MRSVVIGVHVYANDNQRTFPARNPVGYGYPHEIKRTSNGKCDPNVPFIYPYLGDRIIVFCPSLLDRISPTTNANAFEERFCSTQYHMYPRDVFWRVPRPDLSKPNRIAERAAIWWRFARVKQGIWMAHGQPGSTQEPEGMISAMNDASTQWGDWSKTEGDWMAGETHYWPIYRETW